MNTQQDEFYLVSIRDRDACYLLPHASVDAALTLVAAPDDVAGYATAPMGLEEMVIYFDLCREIIQAAWFWCGGDDARSRIEAGEDCRAELIAFLTDVKDSCLIPRVADFRSRIDEQLREPAIDDLEFPY